MNNISRRNFALLELSQCIKPSVGLLHYVVAVHCPSEVLRKMDTEELKCRDLFNIGHTNLYWGLAVYGGLAHIVVNSESVNNICQQFVLCSFVYFRMRKVSV